jgi:hypothetical protein
MHIKDTTILWGEVKNSWVIHVEKFIKDTTKIKLITHEFFTMHDMSQITKYKIIKASLLEINICHRQNYRCFRIAKSCD